MNMEPLPKVLVIAFFPAFSPPSSGGEMRLGSLYREFARTYDVTLLTSTDFGALSNASCMPRDLSNCGALRTGTGVKLLRPWSGRACQAISPASPSLWLSASRSAS